MRIVFCASEVVPFAKTGGLADVCGALPPALEKLGHEVVIITPRYKNTKVNLPSPIVRIGENVKVYFIEHHSYFGREGLYGDQGGDYEDNLERFAFFCHAALKLLKEIHFRPDIVHCHDWHTALIPVLLKTKYAHDPFFKNTQSILTIHNLAYQGVFPKRDYPKLNVEGHLFHTQGLEFYDQINVLKGGIIFSDAVTTVSPQYAKEMQSPRLGCGLDGVLRNRSSDIYGILNGLDYKAWDPKDDPLLDHNYSAADLEGKRQSKGSLQKTFHLAMQPDTPLFGFVARLCHQKGVDLIVSAMQEMMRMGIQVVFSGYGERRYHRMLEECASQYRHRVGLFLNFDEGMAHRVYAGSDFFLMPSVFEPCGLGQMIALRYGSIPLVYRTGGLADTIRLYDPVHQAGNGFVFTQYTKDAFLRAVAEAVKVYRHPEQMDYLIAQALRVRFSWDKSAKEYVKIYQSYLDRHA
jgi:starch synthase